MTIPHSSTLSLFFILNLLYVCFSSSSLCWLLSVFPESSNWNVHLIWTIISVDIVWLGGWVGLTSIYSTCITTVYVANKHLSRYINRSSLSPIVVVPKIIHTRTFRMLVENGRATLFVDFNNNSSCYDKINGKTIPTTTAITFGKKKENTTSNPTLFMVRERGS